MNTYSVPTLTFSTRGPVDWKSTTVFEEEYEPTLRLGTYDKRVVLDTCEENTAYLYVNGKMAGETYGASPKQIWLGLDEHIIDTDKDDQLSCYCYSTTILPDYQGQGYGKLLKAFWLGVVSTNRFQRAIGHATSDAMRNTLKHFGAKFGREHDNWEGSSRTATFYSIELS